MKSLSFRIPKPVFPTLKQRPIFNESRLKLYWARVHAHKLSSLWEEWVVVHNDPVKRREIQRAQGVDYPAYHVPIPIDISLMLGDFLRCLRSSMDYLVCAMAREVDLPDDQTLFPFNAERNRVEASFREATPSGGKKQRRAGALFALSKKYPKLEGVILNEIQPYSADDGAGAMGDLIWRVITADNVDKHRMITPTTNMHHIGHIAFKGGGSFSNFRVAGPPVVRMKGDSEAEGEVNAAIDILFKVPTRLAGKPITRTLVEACDFAGEIIEIFEARF